MSVRVKIEGIPKITKNMDKWEEKILKVAHGAVIKSAKIDVETGAKKKITQDKHIDTGRLRASIHTSYNGNDIHSYSDNEGKSFQGKLDVRYKEYNVFVGTDVEYAEKIEMLDSYIFYAYKMGKNKLPKRIQKDVKKLLNRG